MRIALLKNPGSGSGDADEVGDALRRHGAEVTSFALHQADEAAAAGLQRIVVAGGDGSLGCGAAAAAKAGVPLAVIPVGTANDFARTMAIPDELEEAARLAVKGERARPLELARMGSRPFVNVASLGLSPVAAREAHGLKDALGPVAYVLGGIRAGLRAQPVGCRVVCDGREVFSGDAWQVTVACTGAFGGGSEVDADPHDGLLDAVVIEAGSRAALLLRAYGLRRGTVEGQRGVHSWRCGEIDVEVADGTSFNVDGELVETGPTEFRVERAAVELVVG